LTDTQRILDNAVPTAWQVYIPMLTSLARDGLNLAGTAGFTWALGVNGSQVEMAVSAVLIVTGVVWGKIQKWQAQKALNVAAASPAGTTAPALPS
jgi:hypothetical protein